MKLSKQDFFNWAYADLLINVNRGRFAEYIVATALGIANDVRQEWDAYDLKFNNIKIEVKSSAYIQGWEQHGKRSRLVFCIRPTCSFDDLTPGVRSHRMRQSDVYVFCVLKHQDIHTIVPEDTSQWDFYVVATKRLNDVCGAQKTITLTSLINTFDVVPVSYENIKAEILDCVNKTQRT